PPSAWRSFPACDVFEDPPEPVDGRIDPEARLHASTGSASESSRERRLCGELRHLRGHCIDVAFVDEESGYAVDDDVGDSRVAGGHNWEATGARLDHAHGHALHVTVRRHDRVLDESTSGVQLADDDVMRLRSEELDGAPATRLREHLALRAQGAIPDEAKPRVRMGSQDVCERLDCEPRRLLVYEPADCDEHGACLLRMPEHELCAVDPVGRGVRLGGRLSERQQPEPKRIRWDNEGGGLRKEPSVRP